MCKKKSIAKEDISQIRHALELAEQYLVDRGINVRGTVGRTIVLPALRNAIVIANKYEKDS